jgi:DNA-binding protein HU-beta
LPDSLNFVTLLSYLSRCCAKKPLRYNTDSRLEGLFQVNVFLLGYKISIMNKQAIVDAVHEKVGGTKVQAEEIVDVVIDSIVGTLKKGGEVSIAGLGIFSTKTRAARQARNPRTGESISVPSMKVPKFRAAKALKDAVK